MMGAGAVGRAGAAFAVLLSAGPPVRLSAQCPNGSPPPCAGVAHGPASNSVAVLYFDNLSRDTADAYLADGLTEEIIARLGAVPRIAVKSRFEVRPMRGHAPSDLAALGRRLNAAYLLSGTVQRGGARVRVRVELIRAATRARVWGDQFDQPDGDVLAIEEAIGRGVVLGIAGAVLPSERVALGGRPTRSAAAYDLYLQGRAAFNREDQGKAIPLFQRALAEDSTFALAWAALARAWTEAADSWRPPREAYPAARAAGLRALALDSNRAEAWVALVAPTLALDHDPVAAERMARRAIELSPGLPDAWTNLGFTQWNLGRSREGLEAMSHAWDLDTLSRVSASYRLIALEFAGRYEEAVAFAHRVGVSASAAEVGAALARHDCAGAAPGLARMWRTGWSAGDYVRALVCANRLADARLAVDSIVAQTRVRYFNPYAVASAFAALGERDSAYAWLEATFDDRTNWYSAITFQPAWDPYRSDPRFIALMQKFHVPVSRID